MNKKLYAITTGDTNGIGFEVTCKALQSKYYDADFLIFCSLKSEFKYLKKLLKSYSVCLCSSVEEAFSFRFENTQKKSSLYFIISSDNPAKWVELTARLAIKKEISGIITAPLSKPVIVKNNKNDLGHTEILKRISKEKSHLFMFFIGNQYNVLLATGHIPLSKVSKNMGIKLDHAFRAAKFLSYNKLVNPNNKPIGILGLNPHAGDKGLIGLEDSWLQFKIRQYNKIYPTHGPIVPDSAFVGNNPSKFCLLICQYHDQGLIPFKLSHGFDSGVHVTIGLPFVRTSVDHGSAFDIFGKNKANPNSMKMAIDWCIKLSSN